MRAGLWLPLFEELADPRVVARLAADAEEWGWHGVFVWDQLRWREPIKHVADPWITLAAIAAATEEVMLGPMVTPLARRRPAKVARETATLDRLSGGRLAATSSPRSSPRPGSRSMIERGARCSTRHSRSLWRPGPASRSTIAVSTTSSMMCSSSLGRC